MGRVRKNMWKTWRLGIEKGRWIKKMTPVYVQGFLHTRWCRISSINSTCFMMICCKIIVDMTNDQRLDIACLCKIYIYIYIRILYDIYIYMYIYIYLYRPENQRIFLE